AMELAETYRARDPDDLEASRWVAQVQVTIGQSRSRRSEANEARRPLELAVATLTTLVARAPKDAQFHFVLAEACLALADVEADQDHLAAAQRLREQARDSALLISAIEPASGTWQSTLAEAESDLGATALEQRDWVAAVEH